MDAADIDNRFNFHAGNPDTIPKHEDVREMCRALAQNINLIVPDGREKSLAITHLEDVMMWANAGIARITTVA